MVNSPVPHWARAVSYTHLAAKDDDAESLVLCRHQGFHGICQEFLVIGIRRADGVNGGLGDGMAFKVVLLSGIYPEDFSRPFL